MSYKIDDRVKTNEEVIAELEKEEAKAQKFFDKLDDKDRREALKRAKDCENRGKNKDALYWYKEAATHGDTGALYKAAQLTKNKKEAVKWLHDAAEAGIPDAQADLAARYAEGDGVEKDQERAADLYFTASQATSADPHKAVEWCTRAAELGHEEAKKKLPDIRKGAHTASIIAIVFLLPIGGLVAWYCNETCGLIALGAAVLAIPVCWLGKGEHESNGIVMGLLSVSAGASGIGLAVGFLKYLWTSVFG